MIGYLFPGQGTQSAGMLRKLGTFYDEVKEIFIMASDIAQKDITKLCLSESDEELKKTENTQIAVTAMNMAYLKILMNRDVQPDIVMGHSLGQFSALAASGVIDMQTLFHTIIKRAELMGKISREGSLSTIIGLDYDVINEVCQEISDENGTVSVALYNTTKQIVIGGDLDYVTRASEILKDKGALRVVNVRVSNAFHTPLMKDMLPEFTAYIQEIEIKKPECKLILNCKGDYSDDPEEIREEIINQCCNQVNWCAGLEKILSGDNLILAEVGVGKTLAGMIRNMGSKEKVALLSDPKALDKFLHTVKIK
ncbi:MAG: ACP S-malonyltransferase [Clostridium sp.]|nr:ACP S-malonyltransferase [Clostridium sp.]